MKRRLPVIFVAFVLVMGAGFLVWKIAFRGRRPALEPLLERVRQDLAALRAKSYERSTFSSSPEEGVAIDRFKEAVARLKDVDLERMADLEAYAMRAPGQVPPNLAQSVGRTLEEQRSVIEILRSAARCRRGNRPREFRADPGLDAYLGSGVRLAAFLLLAQARVHADGGEGRRAIELCTEAALLGQDLGRGGLSMEVARGIEVVHASLNALLICLEILKPSPADRTETARRLDILIANAPPVSEPAEIEFLWSRHQAMALSGKVSDSGSDIQRAMDSLAIEALDVFEKLQRKYLDVAGKTYKDRSSEVKAILKELASSANPFVRRFSVAIDAVEVQSFGLMAELRMLRWLCAGGAAEEDPFDGAALRTKADAVASRIWSVGPDLQDQGGMPPEDLFMELKR